MGGTSSGVKKPEQSLVAMLVWGEGGVHWPQQFSPTGPGTQRHWICADVTRDGSQSRSFFLHSSPTLFPPSSPTAVLTVDELLSPC